MRILGGKEGKDGDLRRKEKDLNLKRAGGKR